MGINSKTSQPGTSSHDSKRYSKADYKANRVTEYRNTPFSAFGFKYLRPTQAAEVYWY